MDSSCSQNGELEDIRRYQLSAIVGDRRANDMERILEAPALQTFAAHLSVSNQ